MTQPVQQPIVVSLNTSKSKLLFKDMCDSTFCACFQLYELKSSIIIYTGGRGRDHRSSGNGPPGAKMRRRPQRHRKQSILDTLMYSPQSGPGRSLSGSMKPSFVMNYARVSAVSSLMSQRRPSNVWTENEILNAWPR